MELQIARQIIQVLAQGIHPVTGEAMPEDSPYNAPQVIRALFAVDKALEEREAATQKARQNPVREPIARRGAPPNAGKPWTSAEDDGLEREFNNGMDLKQIADYLGRTRFGVEQRLIKLGKLPMPNVAGQFTRAKDASGGNPS